MARAGGRAPTSHPGRRDQLKRGASNPTDDLCWGR